MPCEKLARAQRSGRSRCDLRAQQSAGDLPPRCEPFVLDLSMPLSMPLLADELDAGSPASRWGQRLQMVLADQTAQVAAALAQVPASPARRTAANGAWASRAAAGPGPSHRRAPRATA